MNNIIRNLQVVLFQHHHVAVAVYADVFQAHKIVPDAEPNAINVAQDAFNNDVLLGVDVDPNSGLLIDIVPGQVYFYSFIKNGKKKITSGKIMAL